MSDLQPKGTGVKLGEREYQLLFTLNAIDDIQSHFDIDISDIGELFQESKKSIPTLRYILTVLINEGIDAHNDVSEEKWAKLDERYVGRQINSQNMREFMTAVFKSFSDSVPEGEEDTPNAVGGQQTS